MSAAFSTARTIADAALIGTDAYMWTQSQRMTTNERAIFDRLPQNEKVFYMNIFRSLGYNGFKPLFTMDMQKRFGAMQAAQAAAPASPPPGPPARPAPAAVQAQPAPAASPAAGPPPKPIQGIGGEVVSFMGKKAIVFTVAPGVQVAYEEDPGAPLPGGRVITNRAELDALSRAIKGGNSLELTAVGSDYGNYQRFWESILDRTFVQGDPARNDPEVLRVLAELAARPDMSPVELQRRLQGTTYWKTKTDVQREWNDLSPAEQESRKTSEASELAEEYFRLTGVNKPPSDPELVELARQVASGERSRSAVVAMHIKPVAERNPESPWSRTVRTEQENQRKRPFDIENKQADIRAQANRWGVRLEENTVKQWATGIVTLTKSEDDLTEYFKTQAAILYPWKDRELETEAAAQPWIQTYGRVLERQADLFNPKVQAALQQGLPVFEFEKQLKSSPEWEQTRNFQDSATQVLGDIGARMGFQ